MQQQPQEQSFWRSPVGIVCLGFLVIGGFFLLTEHTAHVFGVLSYLLIVACPLMHCLCITATVTAAIVIPVAPEKRTGKPLVKARLSSADRSQENENSLVARQGAPS
jgi:Protein of unknown function (DUF2933)